MPRAPDGSFLASSLDAARVAKRALECIETRNFERLLNVLDDNAEDAAAGKPGAAHPNEVVRVLCMMLVATQRKVGRSAIPIVDDFIEHTLKPGASSDPSRYLRM